MRLIDSSPWPHASQVPLRVTDDGPEIGRNTTTRHDGERQGLAFPLRHLANLLTGLRLLLVLPITLLVLLGSHPALVWAAACFAVAALTDLLDGHVARRWGCVTALGAFLDPLADKCVVDGCIVAMLLHASFPLPLAIVIIGRDVVVTAMRLRGTSERTLLLPSGLAKAKTFLLYFGLLGLLLDQPAGSLLRNASWGLVLLASLFSAITLAEYVARLAPHPRLDVSLLRYLIFPRPGPALSAGKIAFFLIGSFIAIGAGLPAGSLRTWVLVFVFYELVISQGKYLINDIAGRDSDSNFLRATENLCPKGRRGLCLIAIYAAGRAVVGIIGLFLVAGWEAALLGALTIGLQVAYELLKLVDFSSRGGWLFVVASASYGVRGLAGAVAVNRAAPFSTVGLLTFIWAASLGALFLAIYWQRQGEYYLEQRRTSPMLLARYKPGVLTVYRHDLHSARRGKPWLTEQLLPAIIVGGLLFMAMAPEGIMLRALAGGAYLCWALCLLMLARATPATNGRDLARAALPALLGGAIAIAAGAQLRAVWSIPFALAAIAFLTYLLLMSDRGRTLIVHATPEIRPTAA